MLREKKRNPSNDDVINITNESRESSKRGIDIIPENRIDWTREKRARVPGKRIANNVHFRSKQRLEVTDA